MAQIIQDDIGSDPLSRKTFSFDEDNWATDHNDNWSKTVSQINEMQRALLGDAQEATLDAYSGDAFETRVAELKAALFGGNDPGGYSPSDHINKRLSDAESTLGEKAHLSHLLQVLEKNAVGELASQAATGQTNPTIDIDGGINAALEDGDTVVLVDSSASLNASGELPSSAIESIAVSGDHTKGTTTVDLASNPSNSFPAATTVFLDLPSLRAAQNLDRIQKIMIGNRDPNNDISITAGVDDHHSRLDSVEQDVTSVESTLSSLFTTVEGNTDRIGNFRRTITSIETDVEAATLKAKTFETGDRPFAALDADYDGTISTISVQWGQTISKVNTGETLVIEQNGTKSPKLVKVDADTSAPDSIPIQGADLVADLGNEVYFASSSIAARVAARTDGTILLDGDTVESDEFDGTTFESDGSGTGETSGLHYFDTDSNGIKQIGSQGWAMTSGGEVSFSNMYLRGYLEITNNNDNNLQSRIHGPVRLENDGQLINSDGTFWVGRDGVNVIVGTGSGGGGGGCGGDGGESSSGMAYSIYQGSKNTMLGSMTGIAGASESKVVIQAHKINDSHATNMKLLSVGNMQVSAAGGGSALGVLTLTGAATTEVDTPNVIAKSLPRASGPDDLVDNVVWNDQKLMDYFGNPSTKTALASQMKGVLWVDTADYSLRSFDPSQHADQPDPAAPNVTPNFTWNVTDESTAGQITVSFTDDSTVENATAVAWKWDFVDTGSFSEDASGSNTQYTYKSSNGETPNFDVRMKLQYEPDDESQSTAWTNAVTTTVDVSYPSDDIDPPDIDPPDPVYQ